MDSDDQKMAKMKPNADGEVAKSETGNVAAPSESAWLDHESRPPPTPPKSRAGPRSSLRS